MAIISDKLLMPVVLADGKYAVLECKGPSAEEDLIVSVRLADGSTAAIKVICCTNEDELGFPAILADGKFALVKPFLFDPGFYVFGFNDSSICGNGDIYDVWPTQLIAIEGVKDFSISRSDGFAALITKSGLIYGAGNWPLSSHGWDLIDFDGKKATRLIRSSPKWILDEDLIIRRNDGLTFNTLPNPDYETIQDEDEGCGIIIKNGTPYSFSMPGYGGSFSNIYGNLLTGDNIEPDDYYTPESIYSYPDFTVDKVYLLKRGGDYYPDYLGHIQNQICIISTTGDLWCGGRNTSGQMAVGYINSNNRYGSSGSLSEAPHHVWIEPTKLNLSNIIDVGQIDTNTAMCIDDDGVLYDISKYFPRQIYTSYLTTKIHRYGVEDFSGVRPLTYLDNISEYLNQYWFDVAPYTNNATEGNGVHMLIDSIDTTPQKIYWLWSYCLDSDEETWDVRYAGTSYVPIEDWTQHGTFWFKTTEHTFTGTGLDDFFPYPYWCANGYADSVMVKIDSNGIGGNDDKIKYSSDGGSTWSSPVDIGGNFNSKIYTQIASRYYVGVTWAFGQSTGHTVGDTWTFPAAPTAPAVSPTTYYHWYSRFVVATSPTTTVDPGWSTPVLMGTSSIGPASDWSDVTNGCSGKVTTSAAVPSVPTTDPVVLYHWGIDYNCDTGGFIGPSLTHRTFEGKHKQYNTYQWSPHIPGPTIWTDDWPFGPKPWPMIFASNEVYSYRYQFGITIPDIAPVSEPSDPVGMTYTCAYAYQAYYDFVNSIWVVSPRGTGFSGNPILWSNIEEPTAWELQSCDYATRWTDSKTLPAGPTSTPDGFYFWDAYYDCYTLSWSIYLSYVDCDGPVSDWTCYTPGECYKVTDENVEPDPPDDPTCYYYWSATYDCSTTSWSVNLDWVTTDGTESDWTCSDSCNCTKITTSSTPPSAPVTTPTCYYSWSATYNCSTSTWTVSANGSSCTGSEHDWIDYYGYYTKTTLTDVEPAAPTTTPTCYYYWSAFCDGVSWTVSLDYVDTYGYDTGGWQCYGSTCYQTNTSATPPADPADPCP